MPRALYHEHAPRIVHFHRNGALERAFPFRKVLRPFPRPDDGRVQIHPLGGPFGQAGLPPQRGEILALPVENLHPVVFVIGHIDGAVLVHGHAGGPVELAFAGARRADLH